VWNSLKIGPASIQFIKFCIVGFSNTIISYMLYILSLIALKNEALSYDYLVASVVSFALSVLWSFYWNNKYTFMGNKGGKGLLVALIKTYISYSVTGLFINNALLYLWVDMFSVMKELAPIINLIVTIPINFILNKKWVFKQ